MAIERIADILPGELYTLQEACRVLRVSEPTVRRWIKGGRLRARKIGRDYRILGSDLLDSLAAAPSPVAEPKLFGPEHPLLALAGIGDSGRSDISTEHDRYLAEFTQPKA